MTDRPPLWSIEKGADGKVTRVISGNLVFDQDHDASLVALVELAAREERERVAAALERDAELFVSYATTSKFASQHYARELYARERADGLRAGTWDTWPPPSDPASEGEGGGR